MLQSQCCSEQSWTPTRQDIETLARVCHEANRALCYAQGDLSQPAWDDAPAWQRESAIEGVTHHLEANRVDADLSHDMWMKRKLEEGWKYGPVKDPDNKTHPCLLPRRFLSADQRLKDDLFVAIAVGFKNAKQSGK